MGRNVFSAKGEATSPESGVGFLNGSNPTNYSMAAYKFHLSDPIVRSSEPSRPSVSFERCCFRHHCTFRLFCQVWGNSFELTASNFDGPAGKDPATGALEGCVGAPETKALAASRNVTMWTYAWTYEW